MAENKETKIKATLEEESCFLCDIGREAARAAAIGAGVMAGMYAAKKLIDIIEGGDSDDNVVVEVI